MRVDTDSNTLSIRGERVLQVLINNHMMQYEWVDEWRDWAELHNDESMKNLKERCGRMVALGSKGKAKKREAE